MFEKTIVVLLVSVCFLLVMACFNDDTIQKEVKYSKADENSTQTILNENDAELVIEAFSKAVKQGGIIDTADLEYKVSIGREKYNFGFSENGATATIMNRKNTHTIYRIYSAEDIRAIIHLC